MWFFWGNGPSGFSSSSTAEEVTEGIDASGLTAIVTGSKFSTFLILNQIKNTRYDLDRLPLTIVDSV